MGTHTFRVTVSDKWGASSSKDIAVTVNAGQSNLLRSKLPTAQSPYVTTNGPCGSINNPPYFLTDGVVSGSDCNVWSSQAGASTTTPVYIEMDLGSVQMVGRFVVYHVQSVQPATQGLNTWDFKVKYKVNAGDVYPTNTNITKEGNTDIATVLNIVPAQMRYVRLEITKGGNWTDKANISEFEAYPVLQGKYSASS